eukprot:CAMPEP_0184281620 /NCGR_PEP_ID=MMETSP0977-20130417/61562_1 /TAXON_ID=483370 /ORGANISM="non described non described, Strain CCMP2097" /LENGTH=55 /DNA_ID=CAMNT_0026587599 /DNA_START=125 /DNA_END=288 /DNA_ORIENTATION=-
MPEAISLGAARDTGSATGTHSQALRRRPAGTQLGPGIRRVSAIVGAAATSTIQTR